ncbi:decarboxylating NADP(+)-dependent phosphogluconate dehydrogenase [Virgibacillus sp. MSJ-26]|uniref:decarboxylating NADP(+)-dependent phosphogluconate dehydrogenase n=1 Tax=Virgibacillus sp. MSJ-26 TaxID=2841522 RepID=UPI001C0F7AE9|nr:decarboxylating NADP(+)-dependent phosphogluconate dehydrogenase [Virgibacillus sp. MSJ-26]MBU5465444.1 decarboxylating NADP(+)-dependent phosphogluconate dehydrogenase [Virgibacillus sp. MSJ-26]
MNHTIGVYGLGVMGASLAKNMLNKGERVALYNYTPDLTEKFSEEFPHESATVFYDLKPFIESLEKPRKVFLMVTAGEVTDSVINSIAPLLDKEDIIMDGGNANFKDSTERFRLLKEKGIQFLSIGVSGGEAGALNGPALMPSGDKAAYDEVAPILEKIAAQVDGKPCCSYIGTEGSGHYVKMVHNGIEYADMQLISEAYQFLRKVVGLDVKEIANIFSKWNEWELKSYLIEITGHILNYDDPVTSQPIIDVILDKAGQKGTGKWTSKDALDIGVPASIITESVFARYLSSLKDERVEAAEYLAGPKMNCQVSDKDEWINLVKEALFMGKICTYAQGFMQYKQASDYYGWNFRLADIALIFRGGCIIQADFLDSVSQAFQSDVKLKNILRAPYFQEKANAYEGSLRRVAMKAMENGLSIPGLSSSLSFYDGYRASRSGAELIQAQRDYFGAHTYERVDKVGIFHTVWEGE